MVAREFQSYAFKRSVDFLNAVDVVDTAEQLRSRGGEKEGAMREKKTHCRGEFRVAIQCKLSKMPPPPGRRVAAPENPLRRRISLCHSGKLLLSKMPPPSGRRGTRCSSCAAWKEENKGYQSDQIHCGGGARSGTRRDCGKVVASEDFAFFPFLYMYLCEEFFFPTGFFSLFCTHCLVYVYYIVNYIGCLPNLLSL